MVDTCVDKFKDLLEAHVILGVNLFMIFRISGTRMCLGIQNQQSI